jgi:hypothetical protein
VRAVRKSIPSCRRCGVIAGPQKCLEATIARLPHRGDHPRSARAHSPIVRLVRCGDLCGKHRVPLQSAAIGLLGEAREPDDLVFPSPVKKPFSDATLGAVLKRMGYRRADASVHGFRSTFRDWAGETTAHAREVVEAALAHKLKDKAEAAYARGDLFAKRRKLMQDWADYLASAPADVRELHETVQQRETAQG